MATVSRDANGDLLVTLTAIEKDTFAALPPDQVERVMTQWFEDRLSQVMVSRLEQLTGAEKLNVLRLLKRL
jgi:hypothetical protein